MIIEFVFENPGGWNRDLVGLVRIRYWNLLPRSLTLKSLDLRLNGLKEAFFQGMLHYIVPEFGLWRELVSMVTCTRKEFLSRR